MIDCAKKISEKQWVIIISVCLTLATAAIYWQVQGFDFINYDDGDYVTDNPHVQGGFTFQSFIWALTTGKVSSNWHPLTLLSHMLDWQIYGAWAGGHHLTNLFFHIINALLLFFIFKTMTGDIWQSAFLAAIFAIHPLHIQSVAWVSERKDVLSAFFWMLTLCAYVRYVRHHGWAAYLWVLIFFILGLMSKPMVVTLPFVLLLLDYWPLNRIQLAGPENNLKVKIIGLLQEKIPLFTLSAASAAITFYVQQEGGSVKSLDVAPLAYRLPNILISYINYIIKTVYPVKLAAFYPYPDKFPCWKIAAAGVTLTAITWLTIRIMRRSPYVLVGWLWFLGTLVPVIGLIQVGIQSMADRYMYLPMIGLLMMIAWGIPDFIPNRRYKGSCLNTLAIITVLAVSLMTWKQAEYWKNSLSLWKHAIDVTKNNFEAHYNLGNALEKIGDTDQAIVHYRESLAINPLQPDVYINLGNSLIKKKDETQAQIYFQKAAILAPENAQAQYNLGTSFLKKGDWEMAIPYLEKAVHLDPENDQAEFNLAKALSQKKDYPSALIHARKAIGLNPNHEKANHLAGAVLFGQGDYKEAQEYFNKALSINATSGDALYYTGAILLKQNQIEKAIWTFKKSLAYTPDNPKAKQLVGQLEYKLGALEKTILQELEKTSDNINLRKQLGKVYQTWNLYDKAIIQYQQIIRKSPETIDVLYDLAVIYADQKKFPEAIDYMKQAAFLKPDNPAHDYNIACLYSRHNQTDAALSWLKQALDKGYNNWDQIRTDEDLNSIRNTRGFKRLIENR